YRALMDLFPIEREGFDRVMNELGCDPADASMDRSFPAGIGNSAATAVLNFRHRDGSNQLADLSPGLYSDYTGYHPINSPAKIIDPNRWQPLSVASPRGQQQVQVFATPHWGAVIPFAITPESSSRPSPPARYPSPEYENQAAAVLAISAALTDEQKAISEDFADAPNP